MFVPGIIGLAILTFIAWVIVVGVTSHDPQVSVCCVSHMTIVCKSHVCLMTIVHQSHDHMTIESQFHDHSALVT